MRARPFPGPGSCFTAQSLERLIIISVITMEFKELLPSDRYMLQPHAV